MKPKAKYDLSQGVRHTVNDYSNFSPNDNVKIFVRARPLADTGGDQAPIIKAGENTNTTLVLRNPDPLRIVEDKFGFDRIFYGAATQESIFDEMAKPMIAKILEGYNGCIFAYGQTGSGKTFTMFGQQSGELAGVVPRTADLLFRSLDEASNEIAVGCSFLEIYNERIRDIAALFSETGSQRPSSGPVDAADSLDRVFAEARDGMVPSSDDFMVVKAKYDAMNLGVMQGPGGEVAVKGLTILKVTSTVQVMKMINYGLLLRETHETSMNATSSRSHTVFTIRVIQRNRSNGLSVSAVLNLIDLAGSERLDDSKSTGQRLKEEIYINSSLTVLGKVISSLDPSNKMNKHVPYRESKLTRILQNSLSGNSYVYVLANINPHPEWYSECVSTLEFVSRCRNVQNQPRINYYNSVQDAANEWAGLMQWARPEPAAPDLVEPTHRLIAQGTKVFWRANAAVDFYLFEHTDRDVVELIGYNTVAAKEMTFRMGEHRKVPSRALGGKYAAASAHGHDRGHSKHHSQAAPEEAAVKSSETSTMMDEIAGEYVFDHIVYINGNFHNPPTIEFVNDLEVLPDGSEAPFIAASPTDFLPIVRPLSERDKALMNAQNHGQTREDIARLEKQAADYLAKAASLLNLDLDRHAEEAHSVGDAPQKLKGMMDADDAGDAEDNWSAPQRQLHLPPTHHVDDHHSQRGAGHHSHRSAELEPAHEDHLPDITLGHRPSATGSQRHLLSYPSGLIKDGHELHKVFQHYASVKYGHEELDVFEFKKMCRELNLTSNRFTSGAAEAAFRRFLASAPIAEGEGDSRREHRIHFGSFGALLKIVAHERACLYDAVVNIILNNFEEGHEIHDFPAL